MHRLGNDENAIGNVDIKLERDLVIQVGLKKRIRDNSRGLATIV